jgi:chemotaxis-related protein WspD
MSDHRARHTAPAVTQPTPECWRTIGVSGDRSCPELKTFIHCRNCPVLADAARTFFDRAAPAGYLDTWRVILEEPATAPAETACSMLVFRLDQEWLALPTASLVEVTTVRALHRLPHRGDGLVAGLVNIRGQLQICVSLHALLGLRGGPARSAANGGADEAIVQTTARLLVAERASDRGVERWVFGVDEVAGVQRVAQETLRPVPATVGHAGTRYSSALFDWQERTVALLDESRIFDGLRTSVSP